jgi:hypothetical protein
MEARTSKSQVLRRLASDIKFGSTEDPIKYQLSKQGYQIDDLDAEKFQACADSILCLKVHELISLAQAAELRSRLLRKIAAAVR